jgi:glycosyltransferase involved in cell wall biosynthesis
MSSEYKVLVKKEYYPLSREKPTIGLLMMVKNEHKRIGVSLQSVVGHVDALIIYDTGSTDNTVDIIKEFSAKHKINLYLIQGEFVDFSTSRNVSLDFADTIDVHWLLLLDTNDELQGGDHLRKYTKKFMTEPNTGFLMCQHWWSGQYDKYFNMRLVKARTGWRYRGSVHEWLKDTSVEGSEPAHPVIKMPDNMILYQDRTQDDDKSGKRFARDKVLLVRDHKKDPKEPRVLFYLAQTCQCLGQHGEALYYSKLRTELEGFQEEKYHSFLRAGMCSEVLGHNWEDCMGWYMKAFEHSERAECLIKIADHYKNKSKWKLAYMFASLACSLPYPSHCILFVDKRAYDYKRWHLLGIVSYYVGKYKEGKEACLKAIEQNVHKELDTNNLKFYLDKEKELNQEQKTVRFADSVETRKQFINRVVAELRATNPKMSAKHLNRQANNMWKKKR